MQGFEFKIGFGEEWPTLLLLVLCYAGFGFATSVASTPLAMLLLVPILVLHSSLQHEIIHGHPTPSQAVNDALVFPALGLLVPYRRFRDTHLAHHKDPNLTDPYDDPESNFKDPAKWARLPKWRQAICNLNNTLLGRMVLGPLLGLAEFYASDAHAIWRGERPVAFAYLHHLAGVVPVALWLWFVSPMPFWAYLLAVYIALSILKIRTFLEHAAHRKVAARSVVIEDRGPLALLFLNNNLHAVHHAHPRLPWHLLPARFRERRALILERNGGYWFRSYGEVFRLYLFARKDPVAHPLMRERR